MAASTGPILTIGTITWANGVFLDEKPVELVPFSVRVGLATGIVAGSLALLERASSDLAVGLAWVALVTLLFTRIEGRKSPAENLLKFIGG